jgi:hypothetical protein
MQAPSSPCCPPLVPRFLGIGVRQPPLVDRDGCAALSPSKLARLESPRHAGWRPERGDDGPALPSIGGELLLQAGADYEVADWKTGAEVSDGDETPLVVVGQAALVRARVVRRLYLRTWGERVWCLEQTALVRE